MQILNVIPFKVILDNLKTSDQNIIQQILNLGFVDAFGFFKFDEANAKWYNDFIPGYKFDATELGRADNFFEYDGVDEMLNFFDPPIYKMKKGYNLKKDNISSFLRSYNVLLDSCHENNNSIFSINIGSRFYNIQYTGIKEEVRYDIYTSNGKIDAKVEHEPSNILGVLPLRYVGEEHKLLSNLLGFLGSVHVESEQVFYFDPHYEEFCSLPLSHVSLDNVSYNFYTPTGQLLQSAVLFSPSGNVKGIVEKGDVLTIPLNQLHYARKFNDLPLTSTIVKHYKQDRHIEILDYGKCSITFLDKSNDCKYEYCHGFHTDGICKYDPAKPFPEHNASFVYAGQYDDEYDEILFWDCEDLIPPPEPISSTLTQELLNKNVVKKAIGDAKKLTQCKTHEVIALKSLPPLITEGRYYYKETRNSIRDDQGYSFHTNDRIFKEVTYE